MPKALLVPATLPTPSMKTLDQIEARIPITYLPYSITNSGSYYLVSNLVGTAFQHGIRLYTNNISINLNGYSLMGVPSSLDGINASLFYNNIHIQNGYISGWGGDGIDLPYVEHARIDGVVCYTNGGKGILAGNNMVMANCQCIGNSQGGIYGYSDDIIETCTIMNNGRYGIKLYRRGSISDCYFYGNFNGVETPTESIIKHCTLQTNQNCGILAGRNNVISDNICMNNSTGIHCYAYGNKVNNNTASKNTVGLSCSGSTNIIDNNTVLMNIDNYIFSQGNQLSLILSEIPESIDWPANVKLTGNLYGSEGLRIDTNNICLDLNNYSITGVGSSGSGIYSFYGILEYENITIRNGCIRDWADQGIFLQYIKNSTIENIRTINNGNHGINVGQNNRIINCDAIDNDGTGVNGQQKHTDITMQSH